ncbi:MAG: hypothetical protein H0X51_07815 [Parachlamydiaceae bacterium]|nr:hypothetical protein [Parachlamydiaceae bacterium]
MSSCSNVFSESWRAPIACVSAVSMLALRVCVPLTLTTAFYSTVGIAALALACSALFKAFLENPFLVLGLSVVASPLALAQIAMLTGPSAIVTNLPLIAMITCPISGMISFAIMTK